jgi:hypothetical protein
MMRLIAILFMLLPLQAMADEWIEVLEIPLMPGLALVEDGETVFETSSGRVIEVTATGTVAPGAARRYYASALPGLGWRALPDGSMLREQERLEIETTGGEGATAVTFRLAPHN